MLRPLLNRSLMGEDGPSLALEYMLYASLAKVLGWPPRRLPEKCRESLRGILVRDERPRFISGAIPCLKVDIRLPKDWLGELGGLVRSLCNLASSK